MKGSNCAIVNLAAAETRSYTRITGSNVLQGVGTHVIALNRCIHSTACLDPSHDAAQGSCRASERPPSDTCVYLDLCRVSRSQVLLSQNHFCFVAESLP
jgi:hypothetical protein